MIVHSVPLAPDDAKQTSNEKRDGPRAFRPGKRHPYLSEGTCWR
jgi:hypothetical protein